MTQSAAVVQTHQAVRIGESTILMPPPETPRSLPFVGREDLIHDCLTAWTSEPWLFLLEGHPGVGKSALVHHLAWGGRGYQAGPSPIWIMRSTSDQEPSDLLITPLLDPQSSGRHGVASGLFAAAYYGGICFIDDLQFMPARVSSALFSLLDDHRCLAPTLGFPKIVAHPDFRFCAAVNPGPGGVTALEPGLESRLRPRIPMEPPGPSELAAILESRCPSAGRDLLTAFRGWAAEQPASTPPRAAIQIVAFASSLARERQRPLKSSEADALIERAAALIVG